MGFKTETVDYWGRLGQTTKLFDERRVVQMDRLGEASPAQLEFSLRASLEPDDWDGAGAAEAIGGVGRHESNGLPRPVVGAEGANERNRLNEIRADCWILERN